MWDTRRTVTTLLIPLGALALFGCAGSDDAPAGPTSVALTRCQVTPEEEAALDALEQAPADGKPELARAVGSVSIPVHFHVLTSSAADDVADSMIADQMRVLNDRYVSTPFRFELASVDRTQNSSWAKMTPYSKAEREAKQILRKGGSGDLNVYLALLGNDLLGWSTFPQKVAGAPLLDGVVIRSTSLPGGAAAPYDEGLTAVHEIGHWLGLFHTFHHGCDSPGDSVTDTPREAGPTFGCPTDEPDTCPTSAKGLVDPIHNYMDYTDDACMSEFTPGQVARMDRLWDLRGM
jgi:hypothetical protein